MRRATALMVGMLLGLCTAGTVLAGRAGEGYSILYFDEFGEEVGGATATCGGQYSSWGIRTSTYTRHTWVCD